ncbi:nitroreductase family protein, partial [Bacteroides thetaiotaomicron]|uniref:nitroreductase family protein n=1 Tax=Bacteroides thetaiotaomicron TaxID=818 RepID=UPI0039B65F58
SSLLPPQRPKVRAHLSPTPDSESPVSRFGDAQKIQNQLMGAMDAGIVSQNISIFCSAAKLATVPRASMDAAQLKKVLKLKDSQIPMMNHPVGYFK